MCDEFVNVLYLTIEELSCHYICRIICTIDKNVLKKEREREK